MDSVKVDVIIPTFHPKERFLALVEQLEKQVLAVNRIVIVNTEKKAFEALMDCDTFLKEHPKAMLFHISQDEFDHGKTRNLAVSNSDAEVFVCMTQDALPADAYLTQELCKALFPMKNRSRLCKTTSGRKLQPNGTLYEAVQLPGAAVGQNKGGSFEARNQGVFLLERLRRL